MIEIAVAYQLSIQQLHETVQHTGDIYAHEMGLSQQERDRLFREAEQCIRSMYKLMDKADSEAGKITDVSIRDATVAAIEGAICALAGRSAYACVVGACLSAIGRIAGDSYRHFQMSKEYVQEAKYYAKRADDLQERLWRDASAPGDAYLDSVHAAMIN